MATPFGDYTLLKRMARGGMGEVFLAEGVGPQGVQRLVVVKMMLPHVAEDPECLKMFLDEAGLAARLDHLNCCQIYDVGQVDGTWFIAMEHIAGKNLAEIRLASEATGKRLGLGLAARLIANAAAGLHHSHGLTDDEGKHLGLVHRDVSPQNILLAYDGGVKLIDFGIAKATGRLHQTMAGQLKGKVAYMSPEQARSGKVDRRSDIFSLGIVLHEALTGRRMWSGDNDMALLMEVTDGDIVPPSEHDPAVPAELDAVTMRALQRAPDDRYGSAAEFQVALEDWIQASQQAASKAQLADFMADLFPDETDDLPAVAAAPSANAEATEVLSAVPEPLPARPPRATATSRPAARPPWWGKAIPWLAAAQVTSLVGLATWALLPGKHAAPPLPATPSKRAIQHSASVRRPAVTVRIESEPAGASVRFGNRVLGTAPFDWVELAAGKSASLDFTMPGRAPAKVDLVVRDGIVVKPKLAALPGQPTSPPELPEFEPEPTRAAEPAPKRRRARKRRPQPKRKASKAAPVPRIPTFED